MKSSVLLSLFIVMSFPIEIIGQTRLNLNTFNSCNFDGGSNQNQVAFGFGSSLEAASIVQEIVSKVGIEPKFKLMAATINNAQAVIDEKTGERVILYSEQFMAEIAQKSGEEYWTKVAILAHEVGHHLNAHLLSNTSDRIISELEADKFSGFILARMRATLEEAQTAVNIAAPNFDTATHPRKEARLEAIAVGFKDALENNIYNPAPKEASIQGGNQRQFYKTIESNDGLIWMAENLDYNIDSSFCLGNISFNCDKYGRLYTWEAADKACREVGWRLPTFAEWERFIIFLVGLGETEYRVNPQKPDSGKKTYSLMSDGGKTKFNAKSGGVRGWDGRYWRRGDLEADKAYGVYWTSTYGGEYEIKKGNKKEIENNYLSFNFNEETKRLSLGVSPKSWGFSCRCVKEKTKLP